MSPRQITDIAVQLRARLVVSSYNEPLITAEWAAAVFKEARAAGLACAFVSNGNATPEALDFLAPLMLAYKVDLKSFDDANYRRLGGKLSHVLDTIRMAHDRGLWVEVVTLLVPGFNDREDELRQMARFLRGVSPEIPWHVTAFHPDYKMTEPSRTAPMTLRRAAQIGAEEGLKFVYAGNAPGQVGQLEDTRCPECQSTLIARRGFYSRIVGLNEVGTCHECGAAIPGIWKLPHPETVCAPSP
jgi:pyruvate formate lyase activating enzyme